VYLTDDHFLLNRRRIGEICRGMVARGLRFRWGCEGRVDAVAVDQFPLMHQANCTFLAFGVEAGTQKALDRLHKNQTLEQVEHAVSEAKRHGIARVHGFFVIGSPGETGKEVMATFRFAARLKLDTFGFNRLCAYRGTPLWQEYVQRGLIDDDRDWHKWFKCSDIDPTVIPSARLNRLRMRGYAWLFAHRLFRRPRRTYSLLRMFSRHMKTSDLLKLLWSPFRRRTLSRPPDLPAQLTDLGPAEPEREPVPMA
jgi:anaerobic magnesium-protoporphyrin IX monomethyl ester cyclase